MRIGRARFLAALSRWPVVVAAALLPLTGCDTSDPSGGAASSQPSAATPAADAGGPRHRPADAEDDPAAPRALPRSHVVAGWVKTDPVKVAAAEQLDRLLDDVVRREIAAGFQLERVAWCAYARENGIARVSLYEAAAPEDAFGLFSVLGVQADQQQAADGSVRSVSQAADLLTISAWQGRHYLEVACSAQSSGEDRQACEQLAVRILFDLPSAPLPLLMRAVPADRRAGGRLWLVRTARAFAAIGDVRLKGLDAAELDQRLGLDGTPLLAVMAAAPALATATGTADAGEHALVWLAAYPEPQLAEAAYQRCGPAPGSEPERAFAADPPHGRFLCGTFTPGDETARLLLDHLAQAFGK